MLEWDAMSRSGILYSGSHFTKLKSLRMLQSLVVLLDESEELQFLLQNLRSMNKWHDSLELGPQVYLPMMHVNGIADLRALRGLSYVEFRHPEHNEQQSSIPGGFLETIVKRQMMQLAETQA